MVNWLTSGFVYATLSLTCLMCHLQTILKNSNEQMSGTRYFIITVFLHPAVDLRPMNFMLEVTFVRVLVAFISCTEFRNTLVHIPVVPSIQLKLDKSESLITIWTIYLECFQWFHIFYVPNDLPAILLCNYYQTSFASFPFCPQL